MSNQGSIQHKSRVLFITYTHCVTGGIERWLSELVAYLLSESWSPLVGLAKGRSFNVPEQYRRSFPEVPTVDVDGRTGTIEGRIRACMRAIRRTEADIVIPVGIAEALPAVRRVRREGSPCRLLFPVRATNPDTLADAILFSRIIDRVVGVNPLHCRFLEASGAYRPGELISIPNGFDESELRVEKRDNSAPLRILFVGRLDQGHKRVRDIPALVERLAASGTPFRFTIVGSGDETSFLQTTLGEHIAAGRIKLTGQLGAEELRQRIFPLHDVLALFSPSEGCPQVVQQAMSHGVVPVCSEFLGIHSLGFLRHLETACIFKCGDLVAAADHMRMLFDNPSLLSEISLRSQKTASTYSKRDANAQWLRTLTQLLQCQSKLSVDGQESSFLDGNSQAGRLESLGIPPQISDFVRWIFRRFPTFPDGWSEWPGTISGLSMAGASAMLGELQKLDRTLLVPSRSLLSVDT